MAILKQRLLREGSSGTFDTIHLETESGLVIMPDGSNLDQIVEALQTAIATKAAASHTHSQYLTSHQSLSGYVPTSRTINGKKLTADITLAASDVSAAAANHNHSGYASASHTHSGYVPTSRTIAGKSLSANITVDALKTALGIGSSGGLVIGTPPASICVDSYNIIAQCGSQVVVHRYDAKESNWYNFIGEPTRTANIKWYIPLGVGLY